MLFKSIPPADRDSWKHVKHVPDFRLSVDLRGEIDRQDSRFWILKLEYATRTVEIYMLYASVTSISLYLTATSTLD